jgi:cardiolipin synthase
VSPHEALWEALHHPAVFYALEALWILGASAWLLLERRSPVATIAWILALAALPIVGVPVYLVLGPRRLIRKKHRMALVRRGHALHLGAWERLDRQREREEAAPVELAEQLARLATKLGGAPAETARAITLYTEGDAAFDGIVEAIGAARHHVHAEYFIFRPGRVAARVRDALAAAAARGVEVRLLVDSAGSAATPDRYFDPVRAAGGAVEWFNPILLGRLRRPIPNFRTHRKIVVVDGHVGFTGGMNVDDDHSEATSGARAWRDAHVRLEGAAVHGLQVTFLEDWTYAAGRAAISFADGTVDRLRAFFPELPPGPFPAQVVASGPDQEESAIEELFFAAVAGARRRVWITTPYFVPTEPILEALVTAARRGVQVRLVVPRETDSPLADAAGSTYHDALVDAGAEVRIFGPGMIHAKTCVVDDVVAVVGSANLDNRSFRLNFEVVVALYGAEPVEELARAFEVDWARSRAAGREGRRPLLRRLLALAARLLAPQL